MTKNDGGPAFPTTAGQVVYSHGMTLRDWFAGMALNGILANPQTNTDGPQIVKDAYSVADAMIAARDA